MTHRSKSDPREVETLISSPSKEADRWLQQEWPTGARVARGKENLDFFVFKGKRVVCLCQSQTASASSGSPILFEKFPMEWPTGARVAHERKSGLREQE